MLRGTILYFQESQVKNNLGMRREEGRGVARQFIGPWIWVRTSVSGPLFV